MTFTTTQVFYSGRIILGIVCILFVIAICGFVLYRKKNFKLKIWFVPIGLSSFEKQNINKINLMNSDYKWFLIVSLLFLVYWFSGYLIPSLKFMYLYNNSINSNPNKLLAFFYDHNSIATNGAYGIYKAYWLTNYDFSSNILDLNKLESSSEQMNKILKNTNAATYMYCVQFNYLYQQLVNNNLIFEAKQMVNMYDGIIKINNPSEIFEYAFKALETNGVDIKKVNSDLQYELLQWVHSFVYSNVFLTPLCQMCALAVPISIILSYKKDYASFIAPWGFLGGIVTLFGGIIFNDAINVNFDFIFYDEQLFFLYHFFIFTMGAVWLCYSNRFSLYKIFDLFIPISIYVFGVLIVSEIFKITYFTTGLTANDLKAGGSYVIVQELLANSKIDFFPVNTVIMIIVFVSCIFAIITIKNLIHCLYNKKHNIKNYSISFDFAKMIYVDRYTNKDKVKNKYKKLTLKLKNMLKR